MGEFLAILRKANGYTQQEVAEMLNISNRTLSSWETDRTTPDILLLPAIADLYKVTVDELLRGTRGESENDAEISEKAARSARKLQYGKLSFRTALLSGFSILSAGLFILAACLCLYTASPVWLICIIGVLGGGGTIACTILQICFTIKAKHHGGIVLEEDLNENAKGYALAVKRKSKLFYLLSCLSYIVFAVILAAIYFNVNPQNTKEVFEHIEYKDGLYIKTTVTIITRLKTAYCVFNGISAAIGIAFLITYFVYANTGLKKLMNDEQLQIHKYNLKLASILCGCGAVPTAVMFCLFITQFFMIPAFDYLFNFYLYFIATAVAMFIICGIIYAVKHKKQVYDFM